ncbi:hypothetical protein BV898_18091 [Hypsibius exemplaris]|uniref:Uncharacterized protein n=1 Tax=Hypsibius exemplaris TaxID=2072580 RepID=A0A9X6NG80_HYPEX|nr:hypothetical protein BV898_18091 [Hypsibius exemplaris]
MIWQPAAAIPLSAHFRPRTSPQGAGSLSSLRYSKAASARDRGTSSARQPHRRPLSVVTSQLPHRLVSNLVDCPEQSPRGHQAGRPSPFNHRPRRFGDMSDEKGRERENRNASCGTLRRLIDRWLAKCM